MDWLDGIYRQMKREWNSSVFGGGNLHDRYSYMKDNAGLAGQGLDMLGTVAGLTPDDKKELEYMTASIPVLGDLVGARDDYNYITDYMRNKGLSWADMKYPTRVTGAGLGLGGVYNFVSKNIEDLYE